MPEEPATQGLLASAPVLADDRIYYPELDGLRFVAFALVYLFHNGIPQLGHWIGSSLARAFRENGWVGVQLFFVLSGFLITTLLLREENRFGRIDLVAFWLRRILRIWPLYYLTVSIAFGLMPWVDGEWTSTAGRATIIRHLPAFLAFLGNWSMILRGPVINDAQSILWSVCVEEQFYVIAPLLLVLVPREWRFGVVGVLMASAVIVRGLLARAHAHDFLIQYNTVTQVDTLLSGVLLALILARFPPGASADVAARRLQWPLYMVLVWLFTRSNLAHGDAWRRTVDFVAIWAGALGLVAVAVMHRGWLRVGLAYPPLVWLGKISYGLYMYHEVARWLRTFAENWLGWFPNQEILLTIATFATTIALAAISYYGYERYFLKLKTRWTRVPSRPV
jgi:peptidoglycan/LPS O-acetylase OafA/YrhL